MNKVFVAAVSGMAALACSAAFVPDAMSVPKPGAVKPAGWLRDWAEAAAKGYTGRMPEVDEEFVRAWRADFTPRGRKLNWWEGTWSFEGGAYWFDGLVRLAFQLDDPELKALAKKRLDPVLDHANANAIGFCWWLDRRDAQHWSEVLAAPWMANWVAGMFARPVSAWYEATGDVRAAQALRAALGDAYWVTQFGSTPTYPSGAYESWRVTGDAQIAAALVAFADCLATNRVRETYATAPTNGLEATLWTKRKDHWAMKWPSRHGVFTHEDLLSVFAAWRATGDAAFLEAVRAWYAFLDARARLPFGATVMDEEWGHPGPGRGTESCALAAEEWSRINLMAGLGEGRWGDDVERAFFNAAPAMTDRAWRNHVYFQVPNRLEARPVKRLSVGDTVEETSATYARKHSPLCCTAGLNRVLPNYVQAMWTTTSDGGVAAALYGPCSVDVAVPGGRFAAEERTDYPFGDAIEIEIVAAPAGEMPLKLRLPGWCANPRVSLDGTPLATKPASGFVDWLFGLFADRPTFKDGFMTMTRAWRAGEKLSIVFPMEPRVDVVRDLDDTQKDFACLSAGPLLFARGFAEKDANAAAEEIAVPEIDPRTALAGARLNRAALPRPWNWPLASPTTLSVKDAAGRALELVPYGCTKLRASMFPAGAAK
ncbi:MAG: glycoside hydrolase family 127 protein [Kiritimatiellae bacterium]|nr:glycoside hydrolase family 127 protein [Kiritimatiellia bacterium]